MRSKSYDLLLLVPSLRISGGVQEALLLAEGLTQRGVRVQIISLWKADNELPRRNLPVDYLSHYTTNKLAALFQYPILLLKFMRYVHIHSAASDSPIMMTHFSTFPFAWLSPSSKWYCFNQDIEWMFVPKGVLRILLQSFILATSRRAGVITTNSYVDFQYEQEGIRSIAQISIWADKFWLSPNRNPHLRPVDVVMLLRKGVMKRLDLYLGLLSQLESNVNMNVAIVTPDPDISILVRDRAKITLLRPTNEELRNLYCQSKIFVSLSDTEGFGLPPLEAMGQGCVPICRNSGGVRCYMKGPLERNLVALSEPLQVIQERIEVLLASSSELAVSSIEAVTIFRDGLVQSGSSKESALTSIAASLRTKQA